MTVRESAPGITDWQGRCCRGKRELPPLLVVGPEAQEGVLMDEILTKVADRVKRAVSKRLRSTRNAGVHRRCLIVMNLLNGRRVAQVARVVGVAPSTVRRVAQRFEEFGEAG